MANKLKENEAEQNAAAGDVDMGTMVDEDILTKLTMQGTSTGKVSGKKKVASIRYKNYIFYYLFIRIKFFKFSFVDFGEI